MKNKIAYLLLTLIAGFSFVNQAYSEEMTNDVYSNECCYCYAESPISNIDCVECDAYTYVSVGVGPMILIPNVGLGYRERYAQLGWDSAVNFGTIGYAHQLGAHLVGHYYFTPSRTSFYVGLGAMGSAIFTNKGHASGTISPDFVFGKELASSDDSRHFVEMHVAAPTLWTDSKWVNSKNHHAVYFPFVYLKYGMSF